MSPAQQAAVSYLARYSGRTRAWYAFRLRCWFAWCETYGPAALDEVAAVLYRRLAGESSPERVNDSTG